MNQVSWSRILQRAGDEHSSENGADIIDIQDRIGGRRGSGMGRGGANPQSQPGDLEMELRGALNRAAYRQPAPQYAVPRPAGERAASNAMPVPRHLNPRSAPRQPQVRAAPRHSEPNPTGIRNFIAISFSVAVVAFAFHQLGGELPNMGDAGSSQDQERSSGQREVSVSYTGSTGQGGESAGQNGTGAAASKIRLDLRPSFAPGGADAAGAVTQSSSGRPPVQQGDASGISGDGEQAMLRRGRELIEKGHISGARMIFEHLAEEKSALGAFALGQTYDARYLAGIPAAKGADADEALAAKWYQRAAELSNIAADLR